jgi:hypothetical protein
MPQRGPEVGQPAEPVLQPPVRVPDHLGVEADAGHDREVLAVDHPEVQLRPAAVQTDPHRLGKVRGDAQVAGQQVGRARGDDGHRDRRAGQRVQAPLHGPVAAPDEHQLRACRQRRLGLFGGLPALRDLVPEQVLDSLLGDPLAQLVEAAAERLLPVCDHRDPAHRVACIRAGPMAEVYPLDPRFTPGPARPGAGRGRSEVDGPARGPPGCRASPAGGVRQVEDAEDNGASAVAP